SQVAATIAGLLGEDFVATSPNAARPLPDVGVTGAASPAKEEPTTPNLLRRARGATAIIAGLLYHRRTPPKRPTPRYQSPSLASNSHDGPLDNPRICPTRRPARPPPFPRPCRGAGGTPVDRLARRGPPGATPRGRRGSVLAGCRVGRP